jgi:hypothetical protein
VEHEEPKRQPSLPAGVLQHRDVSVRVAGGEDRTTADAAPDPDRLDRPVVEDVGLRRVRDRAAVVVLEVAQRVRAADRAL